MSTQAGTGAAAAAPAASGPPRQHAGAAPPAQQQPLPLRALSPCDVEALKRCLAENDGDRTKCEAEVLAFQRACSREAKGSGGGGGGGGGGGAATAPRA